MTLLRPVTVGIALVAVLAACARADAAPPGRPSGEGTASAWAPEEPEKYDDPRSRILPPTGSTNDYLRDTDPALLAARETLGRFTTPGAPSANALCTPRATSPQRTMTCG